MSMNQKINSDMFADLLNVKHQPGTLLQRLKLDMKGHNNLNMHDRQIILINNPFQNEEEEESMPLSSPLSLPLPLSMIYQQEQEKEQEQIHVVEAVPTNEENPFSNYNCQNI